METKSKTIEKVSRLEATSAHSVAGARQQAEASSQMSNALGVQSAAGNLAVQNMFKSGMLQAKLAVGSPNDPLEDEADRVAEHIVQMKAEPCHCGGSCADCQGAQEGIVQRKLTPHSSQAARTYATVPDSFRDHLGSGNALDPVPRSFFESRFSRDFSQVRVHTDAKAVESARAVNALAYTVGKDVVFGMGQYVPETGKGKRLLAHELAHVVQQKSSSSPGEGVVQRDYDPTSEATWSYTGKEDMRKAYPDVFMGMLSAATGKELSIKEQVLKTYKDKGGPPQSAKEHQAFEEQLRLLIRMTALGMLAGHRSAMHGKKEEFLQEISAPQIGDKQKQAGGDKGEEQSIQAIRDAARIMYKLEDLKTKLTESARNLDYIVHEAAVSSGWYWNIEAWLVDIRANSGKPITSTLESEVDTLSRKIAPYPSNMNGLVATTAEHIRIWRNKQIDKTDIALYDMYIAFPFFNRLLPDESASKYPTDEGLKGGVVSAYTTLIEDIDGAIVKVGSGDIDEFALPAAVETVRQELPSDLSFSIAKVQIEAQTRQMLESLGIGLLQAAIAMFPVIGPAAAATMGLIQFGASLKEMIDTSVVAGASVTPDENVLGARAPDALDWVMKAIDGVFVAVDMLAAWHAIVGKSSLIHELDPAQHRPGLRDGETHAGIEGTETAERTIAHQGEAAKLAAPIRSADREVLAHSAITSSEKLTAKEWETELDIVLQAERQPISEGEYIEEVKISDRHTWKRTSDGNWCRFSDEPFCVVRFKKDETEVFTGITPVDIEKDIRARRYVLKRARAAAARGNLEEANRLRAGVGAGLSAKVGEDAADMLILSHPEFRNPKLVVKGQGPYTLDFVYKDLNGNYIVVEAKGGKGKLLEGQGTKPYLFQKIAEMKTLPIKVKESMLNALEEGNLRYFLIQTPISEETGSLMIIKREFHL